MSEQGGAEGPGGAVRQTAQMQYGLNRRTDGRTDERWIDGATNRRPSLSPIDRELPPLGSLAVVFHISILGVRPGKASSVARIS